MSTQVIRRETFDRIRDIVYGSAGIMLSDRKVALVCARVGKRMRALNLDDYDAYLEHLEDNPEEIVGLLDSISTNVTSFFRESHHFEFIAEEASRWYMEGQRRFRFWCCACSTGEEPYSLAIVLKEALPFPDVDMRILATDISTQALQGCEMATYGAKHIGPVPDALRKRYFTEHHAGAESVWTVKQHVRQHVVFRRMNLSTPPFPMKGPLDAVFCRNVMIYFDDEVRMPLLKDVHRLLKPGGYLMVGHAESLAGILSDFKYVRPSIYRRA